jgi:exodeoxyribonuclease III
MRVATWNVNSLRARLDHLAGWLGRTNPDVVCLQETKVEDEKFPADLVREQGYEPIWFGQRTYNGVALLVRFGLRAEDVQRNLSSDGEDAQRRFLAATIDGVRVASIYVPNGGEVGSESFTYKLDFLERVRAELESRCSPEGALVLLGDYNVAPEPIDVFNPVRFEGSVLFHPEERKRFAALLSWGLVDLFRAKHPDLEKAYTWWDYRAGMYRKNQGLRIDHALGTRAVADRLISIDVDRSTRDLERPSDHAPVVLEIAD